MHRDELDRPVCASSARAETGYTVNDQILKYDGEPFEPGTVAAQVRAILKGEKHSLDVTESEAREIAYHHVRVYMNEETRPGRITKAAANGYGEPVWQIEIVSRQDGAKERRRAANRRQRTGSYRYSGQPTN